METLLRIINGSPLLQEIEQILLERGGSTYTPKRPKRELRTCRIPRIDPQVDREQAKVRDDLLFAPSGEWLTSVNRPTIRQCTINATREEIRTQGKLPVLSLGPNSHYGKPLPLAA